MAHTTFPTAYESASSAQQLDLFSPTGSLAEAEPVHITEEKANAAIAAAVQAAGDSWMNTAFEVVTRCAKELAEFTADDVLLALGVRRAEDGSADWSDAAIEDRNRSALGGVFRRAERAGVIEHTGRVLRHSIFSQRHRSLVIWRSRVFRSA